MKYKVKMAAYFDDNLNIVPDLKYIELGTRVRKIFTDMTFSVVSGTIVDVSPKQNVSTVTWDNGKTRQEQNLYLIPETDVKGSVIFNRRHAFKKLINAVRNPDRKDSIIKSFLDKKSKEEDNTWDIALKLLSPVLGKFKDDVHTAGGWGSKDEFSASFDLNGSEYSVIYDTKKKVYSVFKDRDSELLKVSEKEVKDYLKSL